MRTTNITLLALVPAALAVAGCGGDGIDNSSQFTQEARIAVVEPTAEHAVSARVAEAPAEAPADFETAAREPLVESLPPNASIPPDIVVEVPSTAVAAGDVVEFTVFGTPDVTELVLWDGVNDKQALVYDTLAGVWRVHYRVPLRPASERLGISLTAKNGDDRWRRRWVFLEVGTEAPTMDPETSNGI